VNDREGRRLEFGAARQVVPLSGARVLVVDDESDCTDILSDMLKSFGMKVVEAGSAEQALTLLQSQPVDLVITDIDLPGATGIDLTGEIRRRGGQVPVVVVSGRASIPHAVQALKRRADDYLQKPVDPATLVGIVLAVLRLTT